LSIAFNDNLVTHLRAKSVTFPMGTQRHMFSLHCDLLLHRCCQFTGITFCQSVFGI